MYTCPVCTKPGQPVADERGLKVQHPLRNYPCRVADIHPDDAKQVMSLFGVHSG
jgi:hypothetical protein